MKNSPTQKGPFVYYSPEFAAVTGPNPQLELLLETDAHEGPVYVKEQNALYFTTVPRTINTPIQGWKEVSVNCLRLDDLQLCTVLPLSNMANGMTPGPDGSLLVCEQGTRAARGRIARLHIQSGETETVTDAYFDLPFNSPNDVVRKKDGSIWFTDPMYGFMQGFKPEPLLGNFVYRFDPASGEITAVADSFHRPNGLAFSPDESILYINDSGALPGKGDYRVDLPHHIMAFDVQAGKNLLNQRLFAVVNPGIPDGLKVDAEGRVYSSSASGVKVYNPSARLIGEILLDAACNFCFGGREGNELFILNDQAIYRAKLQAQGAGM